MHSSFLVNHHLPLLFLQRSSCQIYIYLFIVYNYKYMDDRETADDSEESYGMPWRRPDGWCTYRGQPSQWNPRCLSIFFFFWHTVGSITCVYDTQSTVNNDFGKLLYLSSVWVVIRYFLKNIFKFTGLYFIINSG